MLLKNTNKNIMLDLKRLYLLSQIEEWPEHTPEGELYRSLLELYSSGLIDVKWDPATGEALYQTLDYQ